MPSPTAALHHISCIDHLSQSAPIGIDELRSAVQSCLRTSSVDINLITTSRTRRPQRPHVCLGPFPHSPSCLGECHMRWHCLVAIPCPDDHWSAVLAQICYTAAAARRNFIVYRLIGFRRPGAELGTLAPGGLHASARCSSKCSSARI